MNPQDPAQPPSSPPMPPQSPGPSQPASMPQTSPPPQAPTPPGAFPVQPEVQPVSAGERPLVTPPINGNPFGTGEVVQVPGGIVFLAWLYLLDGILGLIGCVISSLLVIFLRTIYPYTPSASSVFNTGLLHGLIAVLAISIPISILDVLMFSGFKHLRRWSLITYFVIFVISDAVIVYSLIKQFNLITLIVLVISILISLYVWSKRNLFMSKKEALDRGVTFEAKLPLGGKILIGIFIALPVILVAAVAFLGLGSSGKNLPIPNSPMAPAPSSPGVIQTVPAVTQADTRDLKRIQDIEAIYTTIEMHYLALPGTCPGSTTQVAGGYFCPPQPNWFPPSNMIPKDPNGSDYFGIPTQPVKSFAVCAKLEGGHGNAQDMTGASPSGEAANYYCKKN